MKCPECHADEGQDHCGRCTLGLKALRRQIKMVKQQIADLTDRERLDWLDKHGIVVYLRGSQVKPGKLREAIDAARKKNP